ncbi:hypothetical protein F8M41_005718 [Gigaspora margarita]|uniref:EF-hand domain-containing protein n=1 Tax=Gigaspora margarita TaxID=4874 RepID=A0A8H3X8F3_GIGMA|nr:hypothetical protein F8M41_005718 [Gigaspora margarita]
MRFLYTSRKNELQSDELQNSIQDELYTNIQDKLQTDYIITEDDWNERLTEWHKMLVQEDKNDNNILDSSEFDDSFLSSQTYSAIDINAK